MSSLPVIDISPLYDDNKGSLIDVACAIDNACRTWGFFYVIGHRIPETRFKELMMMAEKFFSLPLEEKLEIDITKSLVHRGYGMTSAEQLDPSVSSDYKETFDIGCDLAPDHPSVIAGEPLRGPNQHPNIPGWRDLMETHYKDMMRVALQLLRAVALALGTDEKFFVDKFKEPMSVFRMVHYPALPDEKGRVTCGSHSDYGIVTLLYQDMLGGLQVLNQHDEWINVTPIPGSFVVNIGDMMCMWSNGLYKSTKHRVVSLGAERYSMPFFTEPNPKTLISCLPNCSSDENPPQYPPIRAVDWMLKRFSETYKYRAKV
ncbi:unnamed protein product [Phytomonas sp. Hart1]|nr:unnamed protein product [Phytomonas sp. Hart1]|eukprot:CCW67464.1 unnamed protein product [Phytomonas sp. isolate Hart1]